MDLDLGVCVDFSVILPVRNAEQKIGRTLDSILGQAGSLQTEVIVMDGMSTDRTVEVAKGFESDRVSVFSQPDTGLYDALANGLERVTGKVTCYMAAGDVFDTAAFGVVADVFDTFPTIKWLTGRATTRNAKGQVVDSRLPHPFEKRFFQNGAYGTRLFPLQQESTFWRSELNEGVDLAKLRSLKLAGDFFLWRCFCEVADLFVVNAQLGSFMVEEGQLSTQDPGAYEAELRTLCERPTMTERLQMGLIKRRHRKRTSQPRSPRQVTWNFKKSQWTVDRFA